MSTEGVRTFGHGRYRAESLLGKGGMGAVYKAFDANVGRWVAVKTIATADIAPEDLDDFLHMFKDEARAAGQLDHGGIVTVYDYDPSREEPFIVMSLMEGGTLADVMAMTKRLTPHDVIDIGVQVAEALHYAHQHGIQAHRDIKPGNIFRTADGRYKVGDFGIARARKTTDQATRSVFFAGGTPRYMAPEQVATPRKVDGRSDLFALCVVLYQALSGELPYQGVTLDFDPDEQPELAQRIVLAAFSKMRPLRMVFPDLPVELTQSIDRGLNVDPAQRFRSCGEFAAVLRTIPGAPAAPTRLRLSPTAVVRNETVAATTVEGLRTVPAMSSKPARMQLPIAVDTEPETKSSPLGTIAVAALVVLAVGYYALRSGGTASSGGLAGRGVAARGVAGGSQAVRPAGGDEAADDEDGPVSTAAGVIGELPVANSAGRTGAYFLPGELDGPVPLLVMLHGTGGSGRQMVNLVAPIARRYRFAVVAPDSMISPDGQVAWSDTEGEVNEDEKAHIQAAVHAVAAMPDVAFALGQRLVAGLMGGADFASYLASVDTDFTAFAVLHGSAWGGELGGQRPRGWFSTSQQDSSHPTDEVKADVERLADDGFSELEFREFSSGRTVSEQEIDELARWWLRR